MYFGEKLSLLGKSGSAYICSGRKLAVILFLMHLKHLHHLENRSRP